MPVCVLSYPLCLYAVADLSGAPPVHASPYSPNFSQVHAVFQKFWQNHMLVPPPMGNSGSTPGIHLLMPFTCVHAFVSTCTQYLPLLLFLPFAATCALFCLYLLCLHTHSSSYMIILSLYIKCQYLDQPAHYSKYLDKFLAVLLTAFKTGTHFCKIIKTRGSNPMFWLKLHTILNILFNS